MNTLKLPKHLLATGDLREQVKEILADKLPDLEVETATNPSDEQWQWADAWIGVRPPAGVENSQLPWYHLMCDGYNHAAPLLNPKAENGALITHTIGNMPEYIGTWVGGYLLADLRLHQLYRKQQSQRLWQPHEIRIPRDYPTLIIGAGNIAQGVGRVLKNLGFPVSAVNSSGKEPKTWLYGEAVFEHIYAFADVSQLIGKYRIVIMALPLTEKTRNIADKEFFSQCREAIFINVGRGLTVCPTALQAALDSGNISHCYLDVMEKEPLPEDDWRWRHSQVTLSPHVAGPTVPSESVAAFIEVYQAIGKGTPKGDLPLQVDTVKGY